MGVEVFDSVFSNSTSSTSSPYYLCSFVFYGRYDFFRYKKCFKKSASPILSMPLRFIFYVAQKLLCGVAPAKKAEGRLR